MKNHVLPVILMFTSLFAACSNEKKTNEEEQSVQTVLPDATNEVTTATLTTSNFNHELISNGKLSAKQYVDLKFESAETIAAIFVQNGDRVSKGQKLAELSMFRLNNKKKQNKDILDKAQLELQDVLIGQGYTLADSAKVPPATMQLARTKSGYDQALAQYELVCYEETKATLIAPFDGTVANLFAKQYNTVSTSESFCTLIDFSSLEASFSVLESELPLIQRGNRVAVTPFAMPDNKTEGLITEINPLVDVNGMVRVKASVSNSGKLFEGMNVRVSVQRSLANQLVVPKNAVVLRSSKPVVFTLINGKAYWNYVQTGLENSDSYTILDGLKDGDIVITSGNINLAHEAPVSIIERSTDD